MVQEFGLVLLQRQDNIKANERIVDGLRLAVVASGVQSVSAVFPEYFPADELAIDQDAPEDVLNQEGTEYDYSGVDWLSPSDMSPEDLQELERFLESEASVEVNTPDEDGWV